MKKQLLGLAGALVLLTGCGQATVESVNEDFNSLTEEQKLEVLQGSIGEFVGEQLQKAFEEEFGVTEEEPVVEVTEEPVEEVAVADFKFNEEYIIGQFGEDVFNVKVLDLRTTQQRNEWHDVDCETVIVIKLEVQNISDRSEVIIASDLFNVYDSNGYVMEIYPNSDYEFNDVEELNPNRKATLEVAYGIVEGSEYELELRGDVYASDDVIGSLFFNGSEQIVQE